MFEPAIAEMEGDDTDSLSRAGIADRLEAARRLRGAVAAYEARLVRAADAIDDGGLDGAGMLRTVGRLSTRRAGAEAHTAAALGSLPRTEAALASGRIGPEHAAAIVRAAEVVSPERADAELVPAAGAPPADLFAKRCREWATRNRPDDGADEHTRHRHERSVRSWDGRDGMSMWLAALDPITGAEVRKALDAEYERLWRDDGGRDGSPDEIRTPQQRMADALVRLITGHRSTTKKRRHPKAQLLITADLARLRTADPSGLAATVDGEPLPQSVLERLACDSEMTAVLFDGPGRPIWVGRNHRTATIGQWKALIARDRGCVGCGADPGRCEAHHIIAWEDLGPTDITNLVLVCSRCHHDLHDRGMRLVCRRSGWRIESRAGPSRLGLAA